MSDLDKLNFQYCLLVDEYERTSDVATLRKALNMIQDAVDQTATGLVLTSRAGYLNDLGMCQRLLFYATGDLIHLNKAIDASHESVLAAPESSYMQQLCATNLSNFLAERYIAKGAQDVKDMQDALAMARVAVASNIHEDCSYRNEYHNAALSTLAARLGQYYQLFQGDCYLDEAIQIGRELVSKPSDQKAVYSFYLGAQLKIRHSQYGMMEDLIAAKTFSTEALDAFPKGHIYHVAATCLVAECLIDHAAKTNEAHCLDKANAMLILLEQEAESEGDLAKIFHAKSGLYKQKYKLHNKVSDLDMAVESAKEGMKRISLDSPLRGSFLQIMSFCLSLRAEVVMSQEDVDAAVEYANEYFVLATYTPGMLSDAHLTVGNCLWTKYKLFGGVANLIASVDATRNALSSLPEESAAKPNSLHRLAVRLVHCFDYTGQAELLNEAIQLEREAAGKLQDNHLELPMILDGLSSLLSRRWRLIGTSEDLHEAVSAMEMAVAYGVVGSNSRCGYLNNLSIRLSERYEIGRNIKDLDRAIIVILEALSANNGDQLRELTLQSTYATALRACHSANGHMHDLDLAIATQRKVVVNTPKSNPLMVNYMQHLGLSLEQKCFQVEDEDEKLKAIQEAHDLAEQCVNETPDDHPDTPMYLRQLAQRQFYLSLFMDQSDAELLFAQRKLSATTCHQGYNKAYATPLDRIQNGYIAGMIYMDLKEWDAASKILSECVDMFCHVSSILLSKNDQQHQLHGLSGISSQACASCLAQGKVEQGIELLEAGRGIMARIAMHIQDDFLAMKEADPSLHARYIQVRQELSQPYVSSLFCHSQDVVAKRTSAMKELEEIENLIQTMPGFEKFNKGLSSKEMCALAVQGPLVAFCTVYERCDALIVTTKAIQALPLPALNFKDIKKHIQLVVGTSRLSKASPVKQATANRRMRALLSWLWDAAVSPVLEHLGLTQGPELKPQTRLWWITSGPLGLLPLHAAGKGKRQPQHNCFAHVISSYISSCEALAFARERQSKLLDITWPRIALVTMPQTPGRLADLDTDVESQAIHEVFESMNTPSQSHHFLELRQPSVEEVVQHLQSRAVDIFHFACHAEPDPNDPSKTSLLLGSDPTALLPDLLPIQELQKFYDSSSRMKGPLPRLVYLSACCTAQQYELSLIDENIHLAAAFQLLGFPAVVGTLWEADDSAAVVVAQNFYQEFFRLDVSAHHSTSQFLPGETVARALHFAVSTCRQQKIGRRSTENEALLWANFVHIGA